MVYTAIISSLILIIILSEITFLGKYISIKQDMFTNNRYASFALGFITYFAITFAVLFFLIFFKAPIIYLVIFFVLKDIIQIMYMLARRDVFVGNVLSWKEIVFGIIIAIGITIFAYYILPIIEITRDNNDYMTYQSWYKFQAIISKITVINFEFITHWFGALLIAFFGYSSVMAFITNFSKKTHWWTYIFATITTLAMVLAFSFGKTLESQMGTFLVLFAIMVAINIVVFSRRRYATVYGIITIAAWSFNQHLVLVLLIIAFVTLVVYALLQKPKVSMFWVQLMAPIALVSTFWINDYSRPLGLAITIIAILLYAFIVSIGRVKVLDRLNQFFIKLRYIIPITIFTALIIIGIIMGFEYKKGNSSVLIGGMTYLFYSYNSDIINYIQIGIYSAIIFMIVTYLIYTFLYKKKLLKTQLVVILSSLMILFALNPAFWIILQGSVMQEQFKYLSLAVLPPLIIVGFTKINSVRENKKIAFI